MSSVLENVQVNADPFARFEAECEAVDAGLHVWLITAAQAGASSLLSTYEPTPIYAAIAQAGDLLRKQPGTKLANGFVPEGEATDGTARRVLAAIINASLDPGSFVSPDRTFIGKEVRKVAVCDLAERYFADTIAHMEHVLDPAHHEAPPDDYDEMGYQVIVGADGQAIAIRKSGAHNSTLSLVDLTINGIPYPAGSLLRMEVTSDPVEDNITTLDVPDGEFTIIDSSQVTNVAFMRLSAWALVPAERAVDFGGMITSMSSGGEQLQANVVAYTPIERVRAIAARAVHAQ